LADYKRFVSYMYEYENGVKKKNVGYARVETRNGECRFTIHMQLAGLQEGIFPTYLIHRPADDMNLVYLGDCVVKNQVMDSRLNSKENNVMESGHGFSEMGGILLFLNSGVFYATQWDDKPVVLEEVLNALKSKTKAEIYYGDEDASKDKSADKKVDTVEKPVDEKVDSVEKPMGEKVDTVEKIESEKVDRKEQFADNPQIKSADTVPILVKRPETNSKITDNKPARSVSSSSENSVNIERVSSKKKEDIEEKAPRYTLPGGGMMKKGAMPSNLRTPTNPWELVERYRKFETADNKPSESHSENIPKAAIKKPVEAATNRRNEAPNPLAARIFSSFPRIYPFEDNEITRCVKIEPKDIGALPSDAWIFSNNSFLLHGYYCYHHLIFAEVIDRYGCRYILGVPGIYHSRERFMARMFGFECFKSIRKRELKQGDFGYWYLEVNF